MNRTAFLWLLLLAGCQQAESPPRYTGYVEAEELLVAAPQAGWLLEQPVREGQKVSAGELLFVLEQERERAELRQAQHRREQALAKLEDLQKGAREEELARIQAQMTEAASTVEITRLELARVRQTASLQLASQSALDNAEAAHQAALARLDALSRQLALARLGARPDQINAATEELAAASEQVGIARWQLQQRSIQAGQGGLVEELFFRVGEFVSPATPVMSILLSQEFKARFYVPAEVHARLRLGQEVEVWLPEGTQPLRARIRYLSPHAEFTPPILYAKDSRDKLVFLVEAAFESGDTVRPGIPVEVQIGD
ncbi:HlyD family secretion protein [Bowmanella dokdonensis]|uniref:HlyD family efflux transporter periplasmic adaptor subunit n=1 Tax=Bowmanella dokdonensis TaxID=751969 RepID=A0A939DPU1_9ALTE|nr:HlyD family efflux transporter periplasmic adaptor subunit [Bowmanella dokdonensis]MBN7826567.1 HlyD family efflux transporter periplasmic adaptor subunit [Bowmanella dokdonensis]